MIVFHDLFLQCSFNVSFISNFLNLSLLSFVLFIFYNIPIFKNIFYCFSSLFYFFLLFIIFFLLLTLCLVFCFVLFFLCLDL